jgi:hypothetical protein
LTLLQPEVEPRFVQKRLEELDGDLLGSESERVVALSPSTAWIGNHAPPLPTSVFHRSLKERPPSRRYGNANHADHFPILRAELVGLVDDILLTGRGDRFVFPL